MFNVTKRTRLMFIGTGNRYVPCRYVGAGTSPYTVTVRATEDGNGYRRGDTFESTLHWIVPVACMRRGAHSVTISGQWSFPHEVR